MSHCFYDNKDGFRKSSPKIKPVRPAPKELENQIAKLSSFIKSANTLIENFKKENSESLKTKTLNENDLNESCLYYLPNLTAQQATHLLKELNEEGSFLLRKSSSGDPNHHPYSMSVLFKMQVYHLKIRRLDSLYTLGEPKTDEIMFYSIKDIIEYFIVNEIAIKNAGSFRLKLNPNLKARYNLMF